MTISIFPTNLTFYEWASQVKNSPSSFQFPVTNPDSDWRSWAESVVLLNPDHPGMPLPIKNNYSTKESWRDWAAFFIASTNP